MPKKPTPQVMQSKFFLLLSIFIPCLQKQGEATKQTGGNHDETIGLTKLKSYGTARGLP